jgi:hypothetical protein
VQAPKILAVASAVDLAFRYGCTPAWWQLWKALYEAGTDVIVTPYRGPAIESPWWRVYDNPCRREGEAFDRIRRTLPRRSEDSPPDTQTDRLAREIIWRWVTPRWERHLTRILERERGVDAVLVFTVPMSHLRGVPTVLRERFSVPIVFYDGDVPASLPEFGGLETGFNIYHGADLSEYDLVVSNSEGGAARLLQLGARRAETVHWAADPTLHHPIPTLKEYDVFFYGNGDRFRQEWMEALVGEPSRRLREVDFALGGAGYTADLGHARRIGDVPMSEYRRAIGAGRVNLSITRRAHATVEASSTCRIFELAAMGAAIVSNPQAGIDRWFEPGEEVIVVSGADEACAAYDELLGDEGRRAELGLRARERVLEEHTYTHRARALLELLGV